MDLISGAATATAVPEGKGKEGKEGEVEEQKMVTVLKDGVLTKVPDLRRGKKS